MYVALTRAKDELTVNFPLRYHVNRYATDDKHVYAQISRFIEPIRELFHEPAAKVDAHTDPALVVAESVGVADEVDIALSALWS